MQSDAQLRTIERFTGRIAATPELRQPSGFTVAIEVEAVDDVDQVESFGVRDVVRGFRTSMEYDGSITGSARASGVATLRVALPNGEVIEASGRASFTIDRAGQLTAVSVSIPQPQPPRAGSPLP